MAAAIVCSDLSFSWPDGTPVFSHLTVSFGPGRTGLIGVNGSGKSTLLRLVAGELRPGSGAVRAEGEVGYLPQSITLGSHRTLSDLLGITAARAALKAIEAGQAGEDAFAAVGDDWDVEERARAWLDRLGLGSLGLDDPVRQLSGGETILAALAALFLRRPAVLLLDEPTNNLDRDARRRLYDAVASWTGVMVIVSHDRELLGLVDQIAEVSGNTIRIYGGNLAAHEEIVATEQAAAERAVTAAAADVRRQRRDLVEAQVKQATRDRQGRKLAASGSIPKMVANARKVHAQESAGHSRELHTERLADARDRLADAEQALRDDKEIRVDLPATAVPAGRTVLTVTGLTSTWHPAASVPDPRAAGTPAAASAPDPHAAGTPAAASAADPHAAGTPAAASAADPHAAGTPAAASAADPHAAGTPAAASAADPHAARTPAAASVPAPDLLRELIVRGPERIALVGPNGAGKTTLLRAIAGLAPLPGVAVRLGAPVGYLPQRLDILDDSLSVVDNVRAAAPDASVNEVRASLARFLFRAERADRLAGSLSGGERFRAVLAALLLARPAPQLLLLDEPTNNLDLASVRQLLKALEGYRGALVVASHDVPFLGSAGITGWLRLDRDAGLTVIDPL
jgi:ATPase subunit of ABC transporter with duplicated ATPase domains